MAFDSPRIFVLYIILLVLGLQGGMQQKRAEAQSSNSLTVYIYMYVYIQLTNLQFARRPFSVAFCLVDLKLIK